MAEQMVLTLDIAQALAAQDKYRKSQRQTRAEIIKTMQDSSLSADQAAKKAAQLGEAWQRDGVILSTLTDKLGEWNKMQRLANVSQGLVAARIQQLAFAADDFLTVFQSQTTYMNAFIMGSRSMANNLSFVLSTIKGLNPLFILMPSLITAVGGSMLKAFFGSADALGKMDAATKLHTEHLKKLKDQTDSLTESTAAYLGVEQRVSDEREIADDKALLKARQAEVKNTASAMGDASEAVNKARIEKVAAQQQFELKVGSIDSVAGQNLMRWHDQHIHDMQVEETFAKGKADAAKKQLAEDEAAVAKRGAARTLRRSGFLEAGADRFRSALQKGFTADDIMFQYADEIAKQAGVPQAVVEEAMGAQLAGMQVPLAAGKMFDTGRQPFVASGATQALGSKAEAAREAADLAQAQAAVNAPHGRISPAEQESIRILSAIAKLLGLQHDAALKKERDKQVNQNANN